MYHPSDRNERIPPAGDFAEECELLAAEELDSELFAIKGQMNKATKTRRVELEQLSQEAKEVFEGQGYRIEKVPGKEGPHPTHDTYERWIIRW